MNPPRELIDSAVQILHQGDALLAALDDAAYTQPVPAAFHATIGGHYRHCLDHFRCLLTPAPHGHLNYDHRERGTLVETDRFAALNATRELRAELAALDERQVSRALRVTAKTSYATSGPQTAASTLGREIMYAVAHAVHHYALINVMAALLGVRLPDGFGVAPSTVKYQTDLARTGR